MEIELPEKKPYKPKGRPLATKPDFNMKSGKYFLARQRGLKAVPAMREAGVRTTTNSANIEKTRNYKLCEESFKDALLAKTSIAGISDLLIRNMEQARDIGGSNTAIKTAMDKIEPEEIHQDNQVVNIVFKKEEEKENAK